MKNATLLSVSLGLVVAWFWADELRRRKSAEASLEKLNKRVQEASLKALAPEPQLKRIASVLNDAHKHILAVSKALEKPAS